MQRRLSSLYSDESPSQLGETSKLNISVNWNMITWYILMPLSELRILNINTQLKWES